MGRHVLVVEDEALLAMEVVRILKDAGVEVVGPAARLQKALQLAAREPLDAAVLDVNLAGTLVFPLALELQRRAVGIVFVTGYGSSVDYPRELGDVPRILKPAQDLQILTALGSVLRPA